MPTDQLLSARHALGINTSYSIVPRQGCLHLKATAVVGAEWSALYCSDSCTAFAEWSAVRLFSPRVAHSGLTKSLVIAHEVA